MKKTITALMAFILIVFLITSVPAALESAVFGFGEDMAMSVISSQNPDLMQAISFALCVQCAITNNILGAIDQIIPGASKLYGFIENPKGAALAIAKQKIINDLKKDLSPKERMILDNLQKVQPYINEAFETNPDAPEEKQKGTIEIDDEGNTIIKDPEGKVFAKIPQNFEVVENSNAFILINRGNKSEDLVEIKGHKFELEKDAQISFSEKEGITLLNLEGIGSIDINGTILNNVENASIRIDSENQIEFAEFISTKKEDYIFLYDNEEFTFSANEGGHIIFDPKNDKIIGENVKLDYKLETFEGSKINILLEENNIKEARISADGMYNDLENNMAYSSEENFIVYFDGTDISNEKNALSVLREGFRVQVDSKGKMKIENKNGITYDGLDEDTYTRYRLWDNTFDVKNGNAIINNGIHEVKLEDGRTYLSTKNLESENKGESFTFKYAKNGEDISYTRINEQSGNIEVLSIVDGKRESTVLYSFEDFENRRQEFPKNTPNEKFEGELERLNDEISLRTESGEDVSELIRRRDAIGLALIDSKLKNSFDEGNYDGAISILEEYMGSVEDDEIKANALLTLGEIYQARANQIRYIEGDENLANDYYIEAVNYYEISKRNPDTFEAASLSLAGLHNQFNDYQKAENEYRNLLRSENNGIGSEASLGMAGIFLNKDKPRVALNYLDNAIESNLENERAISAKKELELAFLDTINSAIDNEKSYLSEALEEKTDKGIFSTGIDESIMSLFGYSEDIGKIAGYEIETLYNQQRGINVIKALYEKDYSFEEIQSLTSADLADTFDLQGSTKARISGEMKTSIVEAFQNPDIQNLVDGGRSEFKFMRGEPYINSEFAQPDWRDYAIGFANIKNAALFIGPASTVRGASLIGWTGKGIKATRVGARVGEGLVGAKTTVGATRLGQILKTKYTSPIFPKITDAVLGFSSSEILESGVGYAAGTIVPGTGLVTEVLVGHSRVFDLSKGVRGIATPEVGRVFRTESDEVFQSLVFKNQKHLDDFLKDSKGINRLNRDIYESQGTRFLALLENDLPTSIGGKKILSSATPEEISLSRTLALEGANINNPSNLFFEMPPAQRQTLEEIVEASPKPIVQTQDELYDLSRPTYLEADVVFDGVPRRINIVSTPQYKRRVQELQRLSDEFGGVEIIGGNRVVQVSDTEWRLEGLLLPQKDKILAFKPGRGLEDLELHSRFSQSGVRHDITFGPKELQLDEILQPKTLEYLAMDTNDPEIIEMIRKSQYRKLNVKQKDRIFSAYREKDWQIVAKSASVHPERSFSKILDENGFNSGRTHNHPEEEGVFRVSEKLREPSTTDLRSGSFQRYENPEGDVEIVVTKEVGAFTWIPDEVTYQQYVSLRREILSNTEDTIAFLKYASKWETNSGEKLKLSETIRVLESGEYSKQEMKGAIRLAEEYMSLYLDTEFLRDTVVGINIIRDVGYLSSDYYRVLDELNERLGTLSVSSKAYSRGRLSRNFDETNFLDPQS